MEGVDIYDPVTNAIVDTGADKVAAWFLDGDYDGRCSASRRRSSRPERVGEAGQGA